MARLDGGSTAQRVETDFLYIEDNIMKWSDTIIQISNISLVSTANISSRPFPILSILLLLIGVGVMKLAILAGIVILSAGIVWIVIWNQQVEKEKEMQLLRISLNSGITYTIVFNSKKFLSEVFKQMTDLISKPLSSRNLTIDIKDSTFGDNSSVVRNMNQ